MSVTKLNIFADGFNTVTDHIIRAMRGEPGKFDVFIGPDGATRIFQQIPNRKQMRPEDEKIGTYTKSSRPESILEDIIFRHREIIAQRKAYGRR